MRILVTGAFGSVGEALVERLEGDVLPTGLEDMDVRDAAAVREVCDEFQPDLIYHLAAAKHAPEGELDPWAITETNVTGTSNILSTGVRTILASTCKAADPETVYGASKLIAERMTLAAGGSVARFYNVPESCGNVFRAWEEIPADDPIPVAPCWRYFISMEQAVDLLLACAELPPGRYAANPGDARFIPQVAEGLYPGRSLAKIRARRGDRIREPLKAASERFAAGGRILQITSPHERTRVCV